jgi:hypothetical protein
MRRLGDTPIPTPAHEGVPFLIATVCCIKSKIKNRQSKIEKHFLLSCHHQFALIRTLNLAATPDEIGDLQSGERADGRPANN